MADVSDNRVPSQPPVNPSQGASDTSSASLPRLRLPGPAATAALRDVLEPALAAELRGRLSPGCGVHLVDVALAEAASFHRHVAEPTCCYRLSARPAKPAAEEAGPSGSPSLWVELGVELAGGLVDVLLGSPRRSRPAGRPLTAVEQALLRRVPEAVAASLTTALARTGVAVAVGEAAAPAGEEPPAAVMTFRMSCRGADGALRVCLPAELLAAVLACGTAELGRWAGIELSAAVPDAALPAEEAAGLAVGDILTTDTPADGEVTVRLAGVAKFAARLGACDGRRAITITRPLPPPD